jgi:hypoxanthine-guanine phosphoribosyltransferase
LETPTAPLLTRTLSYLTRILATESSGVNAVCSDAAVKLSRQTTQGSTAGFFATGNGLDFPRRYRNLPSVGALPPHVDKEIGKPVRKEHAT